MGLTCLNMTVSEEHIPSIDPGYLAIVLAQNFNAVYDDVRKRWFMKLKFVDTSLDNIPQQGRHIELFIEKLLR